MNKRKYEHADISASTDGVTNLAKDINMYKTTQEVPEGLSMHVPASKEVQFVWYEKLSEAWKEPEATLTSEQATKLVFNTFESIYPGGFAAADIEGFLSFYGLPDIDSLLCDEASPVAEDALESSWNTLKYPMVVEVPDKAQIFVEDSPAFLLDTRPVTKNNVIDGCHFTVSVEVKELHLLPSEMLSVISKRREALAMGNKGWADDLLKEIDTEDYEVTEFDNVDVVTRKYKIRIRGFREPGKLNGTEARDKLANMIDGKCLIIAVYYVDDHMHCVGDVYVDDMWLQERFLL